MNEKRVKLDDGSYMNINQNLEGVGEPFNTGANTLALMEFFKPDIVFTESDLAKYNAISIEIPWYGKRYGKQYRLNLEDDTAVYVESRDDYGVSLQMHVEGEKRIYYMIFWKWGSKEREYGVKILYTEDRKFIESGKVFITGVHVRGE